MTLQQFGYSTDLTGPIADEDWSTFALDPYDVGDYFPHGNETYAPDGTIINYGNKHITIKFRAIPAFTNPFANGDTVGTLKAFMAAWYLNKGLLAVNYYDPHTGAWVTISRAYVRPVDLANKINGVAAENIELTISGYIPSGYAGGEVVPATTTPVIPGGGNPGEFGYGHFGYGEFGAGEGA